MKTSSLDILERAELPLPQAKAILAVMEAELEHHAKSLLTREEFLQGMRAIEAQFGGLRSELRAEIATVHTSLHKWVLTCILGQTAVLAGAFYFGLLYLKR